MKSSQSLPCNPARHFLRGVDVMHISELHEGRYHHNSKIATQGVSIAMPKQNARIESTPSKYLYNAVRHAHIRFCPHAIIFTFRLFASDIVVA